MSYFNDLRRLPREKVESALLDFLTACTDWEFRREQANPDYRTSTEYLERDLPLREKVAEMLSDINTITNWMD